MSGETSLATRYAAASSRETILLAGWLLVTTSALFLVGRFLATALWQRRWYLVSGEAITALSLAGALCVTLTLAGLSARRRAPGQELRTILLVAAVPTALLVVLNAWSFLVAAAVVTASWELGGWLLTALRVTPADRLERLVLRTGLGQGVLALAALLLGSVGALRLAPVAVLLGAPLSLAAARLLRRPRASSPVPRWLRPRKHPGSERRQPLAVPFLLMAVLATTGTLAAVVSALAPEVQSDAVRVHLAIARNAAESGSLGRIPHLGVSDWPLHAHSLYALAMVLAGQGAAKLLHAAAGLLAAGAGAALAARFGAGSVGSLMAATLILTLPVSLWEMGTGYVDLFPTAYFLLALLALLGWQAEGGRGWALAHGACLGFGIAAKLTLGLATGATAVAIFLVGRGGGRRMPMLGWAAVGGAAALGPWLARSAILTGTLPGFDQARALVGRAPADALGNLGSFGMGSDPFALLLLPWNLVVHSGSFGENPNGFAGPALLALLPFIHWLPRNRAATALAIALALSLLGWFLTAQYLRYLLPVLAATAVAVAAGCALALRDQRRRSFPARLAMAAALATGVAAVVVGVASYAVTLFSYPGVLPLKVALKLESVDGYLARSLPSAAVLRRFDAGLPPGTIAALPEAPQLYTAARVLTPFNGGGWLLRSPTAADITEAMAAEGVTHLLLDRARIPQSWNRATILESHFLDRHARVEQVLGAVYLYAIEAVDPDAEERSASTELLINGGFEETADARPAAWHPLGEPIHDLSGREAHTGRGAIAAGTSHGVVQTVQVEAGTLYRLTHHARCPPGSSVRLQVNWLDRESKMISTSIDVRAASRKYETYTMYAAAPAGATHGTIFASTHDDALCWFDDFSFRTAH